eukprot:374354_1
METALHTAENGLKDVKHGILMSTYLGKILKPTSCNSASKSSYFMHYIQTQHSTIFQHILWLLQNIKYCKAQRKVNLSRNGIFMYHLMPFFIKIKNYTWRDKDIFTTKQQFQLDALHSTQIHAELFLSSFLFDKIYLSLFRAMKQKSDYACIPLIQTALNSIQKYSKHAGYFIDIFLSLTTLLDYCNEHSNVLQLPDHSSA